MKNIVLIGMMGCGKSTVGALLAQKLGVELIDTDALIEAREGRTIPWLFRERGEDYFRTCEERVAGELAGKTGLVISCGGGLPLREEAIRPLHGSGTVFFLCRDPGVTYDSGVLGDRPLAQEGRAAFVERFVQREPVYRRWAHHVISDPPSPEAAADAILEVLKL